MVLDVTNAVSRCVVTSCAASVFQTRQCELVTGGCRFLQHLVHRDCDVKSVVLADLLKVSRIILKSVINYLEGGGLGRGELLLQI